MSQGLSGARITVRKSGVGCAQQGLYLQRLADDGATCVPRVIQHHADGYEMEYLLPRKLNADDRDIRRIVGLLMEQVWCIPAGAPISHWIVDLSAWLQEREAPQVLRDSLAALYPHGALRFHTIHGDPTLANLMRRANDELVLCDPLQPVGKIPSLMEVDLGKLLQSSLGWELRLRSRMTPQESWDGRTVGWLDGVTTLRRKAWFWCAVHLWRTQPYAERGDRADLIPWARDLVTMICEKELR